MYSSYLKLTHSLKNSKVYLKYANSKLSGNKKNRNPVLGCFRSSNKYAVIDVGGTQKIVQEGRYYSCNRLEVGSPSKIKFGRVLALKDHDKFHLGAPWVENASVEAEVLNEFKCNKIVVYKMNPKKHTRKLRGHRQLMTRFLVTKISLSDAR